MIYCRARRGKNWDCCTKPQKKNIKFSLLLYKLVAKNCSLNMGVSRLENQNQIENFINTFVSVSLPFVKIGIFMPVTLKKTHVIFRNL